MTLCFEVMGLRGNVSLDDITSYFQSLGKDIILINPLYVCGKHQLISAVEHAERSFLNGTNRSNRLSIEIMMYIAGEKQIFKAIKKVKPDKESREYAAIILNAKEKISLSGINMVQDDSILNANKKKAEVIGLDCSMDIPLEDLALEFVAMFDTSK